jgi:nucleoid DNA-binding protein
VVATEILSRANVKLDEVIAYKETKTKPLNEALKVIRAETREVEGVLSEVVVTIKGKLSAYETAKRFKIRVEEERLARAVDTGKRIEVQAAGARVLN